MLFDLILIILYRQRIRGLLLRYTSNIFLVNLYFWIKYILFIVQKVTIQCQTALLLLVGPAIKSKEPILLGFILFQNNDQIQLLEITFYKEIGVAKFKNDRNVDPLLVKLFPLSASYWKSIGL